MSTERERKSAMNPSLKIRERIKNPAASSATMPGRATYWGDPGRAMVTRAVARIAAVAESAPTTRWRDDPKKANTARGMRMVYSPVTTGMPAIFVYPITSGMASAARVIPAIISKGTWDLLTGRIPWRTGNFPVFFLISSDGGIMFPGTTDRSQSFVRATAF